jgi:uncharacterized PurR-regulated membrane protein YhhQ (DUF165 family)
MTVNHRAIGRSALWAAFGFNVAQVVTSLWLRHYEAAAFQSIVVAALTAWMAALPRLDAWLDARLAEAIAQQTTAETVLAELLRMKAAGEMRVSAKLSGVDVRVN